VSEPLILSFYRKLPQPGPLADDDLFQAGLQESLRDYRESIRSNYSEGTLGRLLGHRLPAVRQAAVLGLGLIGSFESNAAVAAALKDEDSLVRRFAHDTLWEIWFRGTDANHCWELQSAMQLNDFMQALAALDELINVAPEFAEARNQRAIMYFRRGEFNRCVQDCKAVLQLNPYHFAAAAGMGQALLKLRKPRAALKAFEQALQIHPGLADLEDAVKSLQDALGERE
jgi:tetratricopeptide (TPR) repeat protein